MVTEEDYENLSVVTQVLSGLGIKHWMSHGTLLGLFRDSRLISWDNDIDIAVHGSQAIVRAKKLVRALEEKGFRVDYRFSYFSCVPPNPLALPVALELNWDNDVGFLYVGGAWDKRNPGVLPSVIEYAFFRPTIRVLGSVLRDVSREKWPKKLVFYCLRFLGSAFFSASFLRWFSLLNFHRHFRSPYFLPSEVIGLTQQTNLPQGFSVSFPSQPEIVLHKIYGPSWRLPDPDFDKKKAYSFLD